jgi:hypothetical protein
MQIPCVYLPGPAPAVTVANSNIMWSQCDWGLTVSVSVCMGWTVTVSKEVEGRGGLSAVE